MHRQNTVYTWSNLPRSNRNLSCCPVMFLHNNNTVPLVTDLPFPVQTVTEQRHILLYQMYCCCGYLVTQYGGLLLITCRRDKLGYHIITIRGSVMAYVTFVLVIVYCFKSLTVQVL